LPKLKQFGTPKNFVRLPLLLAQVCTAPRLSKSKKFWWA